MSEQDVFDALKYRMEVDEWGTRRYYNADKQLHRIDGPAIERAKGTKEWFQNGQRHRTDGPAIERFDGYREWWINGVELPVYQDELNITLQFILSKHIYDSLAQCCYNSVNAKLQ